MKSGTVEHAKWGRAPAVKTHLLADGGAVLYNPDLDATRYLNEVGRVIWCALGDGFASGTVAAEIARDTTGATEAQIRDDCEAFLASLAEQGWLTAGEHLGAPLDPASLLPVSLGPDGVDISITGSCNLRCEYCYFADEMVGRSDLPGSEWSEFFRELGTLPVKSVTLAGGEPFARRDLWELIDGIIANRMRFSILTNGTLIREETIELLTAPARRRRIGSIQVSIDGSGPDVHDASRGAGSFVKALRGLRLLLAAGLPADVRVTVNRSNVDDLDAVAHLLLDEVGLPSFSTNEAMPLGSGCSNQSDIGLTPAQRVQAMRTLTRLAAATGGRVHAQAGPLANTTMYDQMERSRREGKATRHYMGSLTACGCVFSKLAVHHDGTIVPCTLLPHLALGRINRDRIADLWASHPTLAAMRDRRKVPMSEVEGCAGCEWTSYCNGSCPALAAETEADICKANRHDCYRRFLEETRDVRQS